MKRPTFRLEIDFSVDEFLNVLWCLQWMNRHPYVGPWTPRKGIMRKLEREEKRIRQELKAWKAWKAWKKPNRSLMERRHEPATL